ncbi:hypothetical protein DFJ67_3494 [Asanoa ferruginea]|uniref:Uncharacterized protein n=1 Tax=Asanoa ferruginea TaxID=53367 RepID=A0A3D9ZLM8_9ACTN|nr:hypothetical protein [Asanoa ferruginea]REF97494.1 hypothetical protein DFJ67_3494 [Asanoa ferruginea]GIF48219.1 hypothetical protein Afe04nite_27580 [Asanoa ferruginea]
MINTKPTKSLVYGLTRRPDCLAFADARTAADEAKEIIAIATARTWGQARAVNPHHTYNPVPDLDDDPEERPDDAAFDIHDVGLVSQGDWPPMVTGRILDLLPKELWSTFGEVEFTALNGDCLEIPVSREAEIVAVLWEHGYELTRDDELIQILDGGTFLS